jgi:hypothetical protein
MAYIARYVTASIWLSVCSAVYGVFMWVAVVFAPLEAESPWVWIAAQALTYLWILLVGVAPLFCVVWLDRKTR